MKNHAIYPGSFDPVTYGHLDLVRRAAALFDRLVIAVGHNPAKRPLFTAEERAAMIRAETSDLPNVEVDVFKGSRWISRGPAD
jgi:pantetheine-phosphate adenylyltransferase